MTIFRTVLVASAIGATALATAPAADALAGGTPVSSRSSAPWMATLALRADGPLKTRASCGGALIAPDAVLTAAHCFSGVDPADIPTLLEVHVGATTLSTAPGTTRRITGVTTHPRFRLLTSPAAPDDEDADSATFDVAIVHLARPIRTVTPLPLLHRRARAGEVAQFYGHGITAPDSGTSDALRTGRFTVGTLATCATATPAAVDPAAMGCATGDTQACIGDSGGPLVLSGPDGPALIGVFSFGMETTGAPCGTSGPDFFTSTARVAGWVERHLAPAPA